MSRAPLVSVICISYNHERFLEEALNSVFNQTYKNVEIIIVDDCSNDRSNELIKEIIKGRPGVKFIRNDFNLGICKSFNLGFNLSKGEYIIDFATDDLMMPDRIERQVKAFGSLDHSFGVIYTNSQNIDEKGNTYGKNRMFSNPSGDVYRNVVESYFISPPTVMIRREVLLTLGGYDEFLAYEDFDFWVRSARIYKYFYLDEILTKRRILKKSHSSKFNNVGENIMTSTTFRVIQKALWLNENKEEMSAVSKRICFEMRHAYYMQNFKLVKKYYNLLKGIGSINFLTTGFYYLALIRLPIFWLYKLYDNFRKKKD